MADVPEDAGPGGEGALGGRGEGRGVAFAATMKEAVEIAGRFPRPRSRIDAAATEATGYADAPDDTFAYGLGALLDGLEARLKPPEARLTARLAVA
ncbi:hypothetical protein ACI2LO_10780 [Streptomyces sp. NPDC033754]|uniref:hypothetical protein n=1 Tax=unclassified Streptomyces TaxID=2593676 RepID=UPI0033E15D6F